MEKKHLNIRMVALQNQAVIAALKALLIIQTMKKIYMSNHFRFQNEYATNNTF